MKSLVKFTDVIKTYKSEFHAQKALKPHKKWFPVKPSIALAGIIADLMGDGHLQDPLLRMDYTSNSKKELNRFRKEVLDLFGVNGKIRKCTTNTYGTMNLGVNCKPLGRVLKLCGVPAGAKVFKNFGIPAWILENKKYFGRFISRLFSCEATVDKAGGYIEIKMHKSIDILDEGFEFFNQIKTNLEKHFGIISSRPFKDNSVVIRKDGRQTKPIRLKIKQKQSLCIFANKIGFEDIKKQKKLLKYIKYP